MTAVYYAWLYRRYQTYVRTYDKEYPIFKICGGANADDYLWTDQVLRECFAHPVPQEAHGFMDGLSVHYYAGVEKGNRKGSATEFSAQQWYDTLAAIFRLNTVIQRHSEIMDRYDPEKKIGMMVDEWGCWHDAEPGTHPGFLYQQNTMRDALAAGIALNIFNRHCERVRMACIAQMVNVLQAMILTDGSRMALTPTYHVFHMYRGHQSGELLESRMEGCGYIGTEEFQIPELQESVSVNAKGIVTVTLNHMDLEGEKEIEIKFKEKQPKNVRMRVLHGKMQDFNSFDNPDRIRPQESRKWEIGKACVKIQVPPRSVTLIEVE